MQQENDLVEAIRNREIAYFRGELALTFPESYSLPEKTEIREGMFKADLIAEDAMLKDFWQLSAEVRPVFFNALLQVGSESEAFWRKVLNYWD